MRRLLAITIAVALAVAASASCSLFHTAETDVIDCTEGDLGELIGLLPLLFPTGTAINWNAVVTELEPLGEDVGGCLLADLFGSRGGSGSGSGSATSSDASVVVAAADAGSAAGSGSAPAPAPAPTAVAAAVGDGRAALTTFRAKFNSKKTYKTRFGKF